MLGIVAIALLIALAIVKGGIVIGLATTLVLILLTIIVMKAWKRVRHSTAIKQVAFQVFMALMVITGIVGMITSY